MKLTSKTETIRSERDRELVQQLNALSDSELLCALCELDRCNLYPNPLVPRPAHWWSVLPSSFQRTRLSESMRIARREHIQVCADCSDRVGRYNLVTRLNSVGLGSLIGSFGLVSVLKSWSQ